MGVRIRGQFDDGRTFSLRLPTWLWKDLKRSARKRGIPVVEVIIAMCEEQLRRDPEEMETAMIETAQHDHDARAVSRVLADLDR